MKAASIMLLFLGIVLSESAMATMTHYKDLKATYPQYTKITCNTCHDKKPPVLNPYGQDVASAEYNFKSIESADSDGDGVTNIDEINHNTNPGDRESHP